MIQWFQDAIKDSWVFKGFMILMVASFGIWGIGDVITPGVDPNVAIQGGRFEVRATELQRQYALQIDRLRESLGAESADDASMKKMVLDNTVQDLKQTAITNMAALELGIIVTPERVRDNIMAQSAFHDETGKFSALRFAEVLNQNQLTEQMFTKLVEDDLRQRLFLGPVGDNAAAPTALIDSLFSYRSETRVADTLLVPAQAMVVADKPTDEQLKKTYDENVGTFTSPEYRTISLAILARANLVTPESIDDEAVRKFYDENITSYRTPETRKISQLIFEMKEQAEAARALMAPGDDLAKIAAKAKIKAPIDLGERALTDPVIVPFGDAVKLPVGEVSQPVSTDLGWHLVLSSSILPERTTPFEELRLQIRKSMADDKSNDALYGASEKLEDEIAAGTPLEDAAKNSGGIYVSIPSIDRRGVNAGGMMEMNIGLGTLKQSTVLKVAFETPVGTESKLLDFEDGFYVLKIDAATPPTPKPIETVRTEVEKLWLNTQKILAAKGVAEKIAADLAPSASLTSVADKDKRLSYAKLGPLTRFGESLTRDYVVDSKRVGPEMLTKLFSAKVSDNFVTSVQGGYVIARVKDIIPPAKTEGDMAKSYTDLAQSTRNAIAQDLVRQFSTALFDRYPVQINAKVISDIGGVAQ